MLNRPTPLGRPCSIVLSVVGAPFVSGSRHSDHYAARAGGK